jgi:hypothetical protein
LSCEAACLLYDSARIATTVGLRSSLGADRTLIFRARGHTIDLLVQTSRTPPAFVHGQLIRDETGRPVVGASVGMRGQATVVTTDRHGEFAVSTTAPLGENALRFDLPDGELFCRIPAAPPQGEPG